MEISLDGGKGQIVIQPLPSRELSGTWQHGTQVEHKENPMYWFKMQLETKLFGDLSPCLVTDEMMLSIICR